MVISGSSKIGFFYFFTSNIVRHFRNLHVRNFYLVSHPAAREVFTVSPEFAKQATKGLYSEVSRVSASTQIGW